MGEGFVPHATKSQYKDLTTKRYEKLLETIQELKVSHEINITPQVNEVEVKPDIVIRLGIWTLVVIEAARVGLSIYMEFLT